MEGGPPSFPRDFPCPAVLGSSARGPARRSPTGLSPPPASRPRLFGSATLVPPGHGSDPRPWPTTPAPQRLPPWHGTGLGKNPFRSPLLGASRLLPLPRGTEMFQFPRFPSLTYGLTQRCSGITRSGLPHSEIRGSQPVDGSPRLFAVPRVLRRPSAPRHPPRARSRSALSLQAPSLLSCWHSCALHRSSLVKDPPPGDKKAPRLRSGIPSHPAASLPWLVSDETSERCLRTVGQMWTAVPAAQI